MQSRPVPPITPIPNSQWGSHHNQGTSYFLLSSDRILNHLSNLPEAQCDQNSSIDGLKSQQYAEATPAVRALQALLTPMLSQRNIGEGELNNDADGGMHN